ncbi:MAG: AzlD domain-containing protein [Burkholderiaceae bacterium]
MTPDATDGWTLLTIAGLACVTVIARSFFFISERDWKLPHWAERGLQYAPIAALAAVIIPEIVMSQGALIATLKDARLYGAAAGAAVFFWRKSTLGCIIGGMTVYLPLHVGLGW